MINVLLICTGNICRSPYAELVLASRLADLPVTFQSAGTRARHGLRLTPEAAELAIGDGVDRSRVEAHSSRALDSVLLSSADLVLGMAREHRRFVVELNPAFVRRTFTIREFALLASGVTDSRIADSMQNPNGLEPSDGVERLLAAITTIGSQRGLVGLGIAPGELDVIDPYRRSLRTYHTSAAQLEPALRQVERVLRLVLEGTQQTDVSR